MKKLISLITTAILAASMVTSCGKNNDSSQTGHNWQNSETLNEWQKNLLEAEGLPTDIEKLTPTQKRSIQHIYEMITYLNEKYGEEFVYKGYIEPGAMQSEELYAYSLSDKKKRTVTVKIDSDGNLTDDYQSRSVADYCEELIDDWIHSYLGTDDYRYYSSTFASYIEMSEIENNDFQWRYGALNIIFIKMDKYDFDTLEKFAVNYAKFLYEHKIDGSHRINVVCEWPSYEVSINNCDEWYKEQEYIGFYCLSFINKHETISTDSCRTEVDYRGRANYYDRTGEEYTIDEYFSKY